MYSLLHGKHLERFYALRGGRGVPVAANDAAEDSLWLDELARAWSARASDGVLSLDVQGMHCSGCVWLLEETFRRCRAAGDIQVNPALGRVTLHVAPAFPLAPWVREVRALGYRLGPARKATESNGDGLLVRLGICAALAMNSMLFSLALYAGLSEGRLFELFHRLNYGLAAGAVLVGGAPFFTSAWRSLRRGLVHLDTPIALGIAVAFAGSTWALLTGRHHAVYFDTVTVFIALMLLGRWLQERVLSQHQRFLLADSGLDGLLARRNEPTGPRVVQAHTIKSGDALIVATGELVVVDGILRDGHARLSLEWIDGESEPRSLGSGETIPAGAINAGPGAFTVVANRDFEHTSLRPLFDAHRDGTESGATWHRFSVAYVIIVVAVALIGFAVWATAFGDPWRGVEVMTAVLVVTCPCAIGLATPLGRELALRGLRRAGLYVRDASFLERARTVTRLAFDKTGTLTTGTSGLTDGARAGLSTLSPEDRDVLAAMATQSAHPKCAAVSSALATLPRGGARSIAAVREHAGAGLEATVAGARFRLGAPAFAAPGAKLPEDTDLVFSKNETPILALDTAEVLRPGTQKELDTLSRRLDEVWILSGDRQARVDRLARALHVPRGRAIGAMSPEDKGQWVIDHDHGDTLVVGDGINDSLLVSRAHCSGTPAVGRPFLPTRADFFLVTPGLAPISLALTVAQRLATVERRNIGIAVAYNTIAVALALGGMMQPWVAALVMPASSLSVLFLTRAQLSSRSRLWTS